MTSASDARKRAFWRDLRWLGRDSNINGEGTGSDREEKDMEETGMGDLQFKLFLKQPVRRMEAARDEPDADEVKARLEEIIQDLRGDIES